MGERNYSWNGVVREEMDLRRFMELQEQAERIYGPGRERGPWPPQRPLQPVRFLDLIRRKPRRSGNVRNVPEEHV